MTEQPERPRDELIKLIETGDLDQGTQVIAAVLLREVLPALDRISKQIAALNVSASAGAMALAEIHSIYGHLQDILPKRVVGPIARQRAEWRERLEKAISYLEKAGRK
jgi:hypothetical protein